MRPTGESIRRTARNESRRLVKRISGHGSGKVTLFAVYNATIVSGAVTTSYRFAGIRLAGWLVKVDFTLVQKVAVPLDREVP